MLAVIIQAFCTDMRALLTFTLIGLINEPHSNVVNVGVIFL